MAAINRSNNGILIMPEYTGRTTRKGQPMPRGVDYKADLLDDLRSDKKYAALYLSAAYDDSLESFLVALRNVAEAQKGLAKVAAKAHVNRENLYRMLSAKGNPQLRRSEEHTS